MGNENLNLDIDESSNEQNNFSIPQEYQAKGWARFFDGKEGDELKTELFKAYDNSQSLIGKKVGDYISETDLTQLDNWEELKTKLIEKITPQYQTPDEATAYELEKLLLDDNGNEKYQAPKEVLDEFSEVFKNIGLNVNQAQELTKAYLDFEMSKFKEFTNPEELEANLSEMFKSSPQQRKECEGLLREFLNDEDKQFIENTVPNNVVTMFYKVAKGLVDKYGYKESGARDNPIVLTRSDDEKQNRYNELCNQLNELSNRTHTSDEKQKIIDELSKVFA